MRLCGSTPDGRLVQDQQTRPMEQADGNVETPLHASRQVLRPLLGTVRERDDLEHLVDPARQLRATHPVQPAEEAQVLAGAEVRVDGEVLRHVADLLLGRRRAGLDGDPVDHHVAAVPTEDPADHRDRGRLAGTVGSEEAVCLADRDFERDAVDSQALGEPLAKTRAGQADCRSRNRRPLRRGRRSNLGRGPRFRVKDRHESPPQVAVRRVRSLPPRGARARARRWELPGARWQASPDAPRSDAGAGIRRQANQRTSRPTAGASGSRSPARSAARRARTPCGAGGAGNAPPQERSAPTATPRRTAAGSRPGPRRTWVYGVVWATPVLRPTCSMVPISERCPPVRPCCMSHGFTRPFIASRARPNGASPARRPRRHASTVITPAPMTPARASRRNRFLISEPPAWTLRASVRPARNAKCRSASSRPDERPIRGRPAFEAASSGDGSNRDEVRARAVQPGGSGSGGPEPAVY